MTKPFTIALIQMKCDPNPEANAARALDRLADAANKGAHIVCLPELYLSHYFCQTEDPRFFDLAEPIPGPTTRALAKSARDASMTIVGSIFEKRAPGLYHNSIVVIDETGSLVGVYRKMHIPDDPLYLEKYYFTPGDLGFQSFETSRANIGTLICWDQWYPEAARITALKGASYLVLSDGHRLAPTRERAIRQGPGGCMGDDPARACDFQRGFRRGGQQNGARRSRGRRARVLGKLVRGGSVRSNPGQSRGRIRGNPAGRMRSRAPRRDAEKLAFPPR